MRRIVFWGALALGALVALPLNSALANCDQLRADIANMDAKSSRQPGYLELRAQLGSLYGKLCSSTTPGRAAEFWYDLDGNNLGPAGGARPAKAAYTATAEIGRACASSGNPGMCALARGAFAMCASPPDADTKATCNVLGAYPTTGDDPAPPAQAPPPLPPVSVTLGGRSFALEPDCLNVLANVATDDPAGRAKPGTALRFRMLDGNRLETMSGSCAAVLAALEAMVGTAAKSDPGRFWPALTQLAAGAFAAPGAAPAPRMPLEFCRQAEANMNTCRKRQESMGPVDQAPHSNSGQAGAFGDCYKLYQKAFGMCHINASVAAARPAPAAPPVQAKPQPNPPQASSAPPPRAGPAMSPQCQALVSTYVGAAQANDGPGAVAGYNALKRAGGCGVLSKVDRAPPPTGAPTADDPRFAARGATPLSDQVVGACDASPAECAARVRQLQAGTSPEAKAALISNAIGIGLELGAMMGGAVLSAVLTGGGGGGNMNSIGNRPVSRTYGQGSPSQPSTGPVHQGCVDCRTGTAR